MNKAEELIKWLQDIGLEDIKYTQKKEYLHIEIPISSEINEAEGELLDNMLDLREMFNISHLEQYSFEESDGNYLFEIDAYFPSEEPVEAEPKDRSLRKTHTEEFENNEQIIFNEKMSKRYTREITNSNNMKGIEEEYITESGDRLLIERINDKLESITWVRNLTVRSTTKKMKNDRTKEYSSFFVSFPKPLLNYLGAEGCVYLYEHFEKICVSTVEPPEEVSYKKVTLNLTTGKKSPLYDKAVEHYDRVITVPLKFWKLSIPSVVEIKLHDHDDYISPTKKLVTIDVIPKGELAPIMKNEEITELLNTLS